MKMIRVKNDQGCVGFKRFDEALNFWSREGIFVLILICGVIIAVNAP